MKNTKNTLLSSANYFKEELKKFYDKSELDQLLYITFLHYFNLNRIDLVLKADNQLSELDFNKVINVVTQLKKSKPLAYILGEVEFFGLELKIDENTLIPRPETEELVQLIINENEGREQLSILDIGTGSGCIALALKANLLDSTIYAWDISDKALEKARENAIMNSLQITIEKVDILKKPIVSKKVDVIVSNPPYICYDEKKLMEINVLNYEPHLALFVKNNNPLEFYNAIADFALNHLKESGKLYFEINEKYAKEVQSMLIEKAFKNVNLVKDLNGKERIVKCHLK